MTQVGEGPSELLHRAVEAAERERMRLAADLHDGPVQRLTGLLYRLEREALLDDPVRASRALEDVRSSVSAEIRSLRNLMADLRPPCLAELGLDGAIRQYVIVLSEQTGISGLVEMTSATGLDPASETTVYRIVQEALTNVAKHSGASSVTVRGGTETSSYVVSVTDDGRGFDLAQAHASVGTDHFGLVGMRERVTIVGGRLTVASSPATGTTVTVRVPLDGVSVSHG